MATFSINSEWKEDNTSTINNHNSQDKTFPLSIGCYCRKRNGSSNVFECLQLNQNPLLLHAPIWSLKNTFTPKQDIIEASANDLIPQTAVYYHSDCLKHDILPLYRSQHPEQPARISYPLHVLKKFGLLKKCKVITPREATQKELLLTHSLKHIQNIQNTQHKALKIMNRRVVDDDGVAWIEDNTQMDNNPATQSDDNLAGFLDDSDHSDGDNDNAMDIDMDDNDNNDNKQDVDVDVNVRSFGTGWLNEDTFYNQHSNRSAKLAAGASIDLVENILTNKCRNGIALVRPPGHHCDHNKPQGFCLFNNVVVAVNKIKKDNLAKKILIVDWDLHHGNGTQNMFYDDNDVLYFSVHRSDFGFFYPRTGKIEEDGNGFNVNVPLNAINDDRYRYGDGAYIDIFKCILIPIANEFKPDIIIVSCGFDACIHDMINGNVMAVTPACYGVLTRMLINICPKIAVILEGGYNIYTMSSSISYVVWALLRGQLYNNTNDIPEVFNLNNSQIGLFIENTQWYRSIFFEYEFKKFVLNMDENLIEKYDKYYKANKHYDTEQQIDLTKDHRRNVIKRVLIQHIIYWKSLQPFVDYFGLKPLCGLLYKTKALH